MLRTISACVASVAITLAVVAATGAIASSSTSSFAPPCPHPVYGADGTMGPLFCVIDNPLALRYYAASGRHTFALGPDATPTQVVAALKKDFSTLPITCSVYRLAAWRNHWSFGVSPALQLAAELKLFSGWCSDPTFKVSD